MLDEYETWLENSKKYTEPYTRSNFYFISNEGGLNYDDNAVCYEGIKCEGGIDKLFVWHPYYERCEDYVNFLLNSRWLGHVFITKNYMDGVNNGFEIDCSTPHNVLRGAIVTLRTPFEHCEVPKLFNKIKGWGYRDEVAFLFSIVLRGCVNGKEISPYFIDHGIELTEHVFLEDIIKGKLWGQNLPANVCGNYSTPWQADIVRKPINEITKGFCCDTSYGTIGSLHGSRLALVNPSHKPYITDVIRKHPETIVNIEVFGEKLFLENTNENLKSLIDLYMKEYEIA